MSQQKKTATTTEVVTAPVVKSVAALKTTAEVKREKQERMRIKNRTYLLEPKMYRERTLEPLVKQFNKLLLLALALGNSANSEGGVSAEKTDRMVKAIRERFSTLKDMHVAKLRKLGTYYSTLYRVAGKRAERVARGEAVKPRKSVMHLAISSFQPSLYNFIREASASNEALRAAATCSTFNTESPLQGYMSPTYAAQFILAYVASNRRFNPANGQYIQPDDLMNKHLSQGMKEVLSKIAADSRPKEIEKAKKFPGQFTFCKLQELIGFYRVRQVEGSEAALELAALRKDEDNSTVLLSEFETMSKIREEAYDRLHADPKYQKPSKAVGSKGPRGPLSEEQKHARKVKREMKAAAGAFDLEIEVKEKPRKPVVVSAAQSVGASVATA